MLKFLLGRILPRERSINMDLPHSIYGDDDPVEALATIIRAMAEGKISPSEGAALSSVMEAYRRASADAELVQRMDDLAGHAEKGHELAGGWR